MNAEENRLQTYQTWPDNAPVHPRQLAREGFFATENFLETECFCCHKRIGDWQYGDSITTRHLHLNAECNFLLNPAETGNLPMPIIAQQQQHSTTNELVTTSVGGCSGTLADVSSIDYKKEANRLASFANWPNPNITPQELAKAGFYYLNRNDQVHCAWCKGVLAQWEKEDNAFEEHMRFSPECPRVLLGPYIELVSDDIRDLGIQQLTPPKRPKFSSLDARLRTYTKWPISDIQRPEVLAQAGFYYHDVDDQVRCFHCLMGLRSWEKEDDPWFEHAKWFPQCQFVRLVKGPTYVQQVQEMTRLNASQQTAAAAETCEDVPPPSRQQTAATSIEEAMESVAVLQALEIGIDVGAIRTATQRRLALTGHPYDTVENLLKAVFGDPDDDEFSDNVSNDSENTATVAAIVQRIRQLTEIGGGASSSATGSSCIPPPSAESHTVGVDVPPRTVDSFTTPPPPFTTHHTPTCSSASRSLRDEKPKTTTTTITATTTTNITTKAALPQPEESEPLRNRTLEEENRKLKDARLCKVCLDEEIGVVFLPCGHLVTCVQCAPGVNQCPICRTVIKGFARAFLS